MPNMKDVAKKAGVGVGTVSRVLNTPHKVSDATRLKVEKAIKELGYYSNEIARTLKTRNTRNVALLLPSIWHPFFSGFAYYIESYLDKYNYRLMLCNSDGKPDKEVYYLDMLNEKKVSGIIAISYNQIDDHINSDLPIISFDRHFKNDVTCITSDNYDGGRQAAKTLNEAGCRKIAYVGTINNHIDTEVKYRKQGFESYCKQQDYNYLTYTVEDPINDYDQFLDTFFEQHKDSDGVFVENDNLAMKLIKKAEVLNIKIPEQLKVIGYDGIGFNDFFEPELTTIVQPLEAMAKASVDKLIKIIEEGSEVERIVLPIDVKLGKST